MNRYAVHQPRIRPMVGQTWRQTFLDRDCYVLACELIDRWLVYYVDPKDNKPDTRQYCEIETKLLITLYERAS